MLLAEVGGRAIKNASCSELDDLMFGGFGGAICCGHPTDPS